MRKNKLLNHGWSLQGWQGSLEIWSKGNWRLLYSFTSKSIVGVYKVRYELRVRR